MQNVSVKTVDGKAFNGHLEQITNSYICVSHNDRLAENPFSGTIILINMITSIDFYLPHEGHGLGSDWKSGSSRGSVA